jgi:hypothetical protein
MGNSTDKNRSRGGVSGSFTREKLGQSSKAPESNLRDFRIDGGSVPELSTPRSLASTQFASPERLEKIPRQQVKAQGLSSSMTEWTDSDESELESTHGLSPQADSLWGDWKEELNQEVLPAPVTATPPQTAPATVETESPEQTTRPEEWNEQPWAAELALAERKAEREGYVDFANSYQKQELLKIRTLEFLKALQKAFREQVEIFNLNRKSPSHSIQIYKVSKTAGDFMLFRNGVKLVVSGQKAGRIHFAFNQYLGQIFSPTQNPSLEIEAEWGPFDQLFWSFKNERVQIQDVVRYFVYEFVNQSFK